MAGDWLKMEVTTPNKVEIIEIAYLLDVSKHEALGMFTEYLAWLNQHCEAGKLPLSSINLINHLTGNKDFCHALASVGWLTICEGYIEVTKYDRHNSNNAKSRAEGNRRAAKLRAEKKLEEGLLLLAEEPKVTENVLHFCIPEKRREEKNREENNSPVREQQEELKNVVMESDNKP